MEDAETLIRVEDLCKIYNPGENEVRALDHVSLEIKKGELVAIIGQSGSGKSTFMNMLGCLGCADFRTIFSEWNRRVRNVGQ